MSGMYTLTTYIMLKFWALDTDFDFLLICKVHRCKYRPMLWQIRPSVRPSVCPSVTLQYCVKMRERRMMRSSPSGSPVLLVFWCQEEWLMGDDPVQVKFECKEVDPCENSRTAHISPHSSGTVTYSRNVQLRRIESRPLAFQRAINQGRASPLTSPRLCTPVTSVLCETERLFCLKVISNKFLKLSTLQ